MAHIPYGKVNEKGVCHHCVTGKHMSTIYCYQVFKKIEARYYRKCVWSESLCNPFTQKLGLEAQFEIIDDKIDTEYDRTKNTNIK